MAVKFLSDEWLGEVESRLNANDTFQNAAKGQSARLLNEVNGAPGGDVKYGFVLDGGKVQLVKGDLENAEATLTQDYATAVSMSKQEMTGQQAFMQGKVKITGNLMKMMQLQGVFGAMPGAMGDLEVEY
ncbi:MAG TPA: SCP2 sterol-binding domain-containing protein [Actinomycetota bacterium]|nr:SCP2 sterol-binding domain-containing protein [Actinomycetota bacterium]